VPGQTLSTVENNFTKGLITEATGLNFPENAATDTQNCIYTLIGDVTRREGFDYEVNAIQSPANSNEVAISSYKWNNVGGDGLTEIVVRQVGSMLYFYKSSASTITNPLSNQLLGSTVNVSNFVAAGGTFDPTLECQYSDGNGYLFVYHPTCEPFYCSFVAGVITGTAITVQIRDFVGLPETVPGTTRPLTLSNEHLYNLTNQGWVAGNAWGTASSSTVQVQIGLANFTVAASLPVTLGQSVYCVNTVTAFPGGFPIGAGSIIMSGVVTAYSGTSMTINVTSTLPAFGSSFWSNWDIFPYNEGLINTWHTDIGNYPSNSDVWWYFKDNTGIFNPTTTIGNVTLGTNQAPSGSVILNAFSQQRTLVTGISSLTPVATTLRPRTGAWFQGRVWYTGVDASQPAIGDTSYYTWTESIYFSQIVETAADFGSCYQINDPTSEQLFNLLPTDGGVIQIQGSGSIYKLFPLLNALLVFAANGIWYISGNSGIGFTANDYSVVKLSAVKCLSSYSFVDINGLPMFWNEEGIYQVEPAKQGTQLLNSPLHVQPLEVNPLTIGTILTYYNNIPLQSKKYARGAYSPIDYVVQWCFRSENETDVSSRYTFDTIMNYNTSNKAFYPYTFTTGNPIPAINGMVYVSSPGGSAAPNSVFKYLVSINNTTMTFAEENNDTFTDWVTAGQPTDYTSYFITGFRVHGQGQRRFQIPYIDMFIRNDGANSSSYNIQSVWDYANTGNSGRWSTLQNINTWSPNYSMSFRRHRLRGRGLALQIKVTSSSGQPFDIMGWSTYETANTGV
jgi:hypothetical protein